MMQNGGGSFSIGSFSLGSAFEEVETFDVLGELLGGGTVARSFNLDGDESTFETFNLFEFTDLVSINWLFEGGNQGLFNIDNINTEVTVVPLPPAVWLFGAGLIGIFGFTKRSAS